jgi:hypothetical protein
MAMQDTGISLKAVMAELQALKAQRTADQAKIAALEASRQRGPTPPRCKVSEKGCVTFGGGRMRRMGATYYATEWQTILDNADMIRKFIEANKAVLSYKDADKA